MKIYIEGGFYTGDDEPFDTDQDFKNEAAIGQWKERCDKAKRIHDEIQATKDLRTPEERTRYFWRLMADTQPILDPTLSVYRRHHMELEYPHPNDAFDRLVQEAIQALDIHPPQPRGEPQ